MKNLYPYFIRIGNSPHSFKAGFIGRDGEVVISHRFGDAGQFKDGYAPVQIEGLWGIIDTDGRLIFPCQWRFPVRFVNGFGVVREFQSRNERRGFLRLDGTWVVRPKYILATAFSCARAQVFDGLHYGFIDENGQEAISLIYRDSRPFSENCAPVKIGAAWGYIDVSGNTVISPQFDLAMPFNEGLARVQSRGKWGFINHDAEWVVPPKFSLVWDMHCGRSAAQMNPSDLMGFINTTGEFVIDPIYSYISSFEEKLAWVARAKEKFKQCISVNGMSVISGAIRSAEAFHMDRCLIETDSTIGYLDRSGQVVWEGLFVERVGSL
jgi:hypothetical protein